jgi:hypothetical protein
MDSFGSRLGQVAGFFEHINEPSVSQKAKNFLTS